MTQHDPPPSWARFLTGELYDLFVTLVETEIQRRDLSYEMGDGVVEVKLPHRPPTSFGLLNLAQLCHQVDVDTWRDVIVHHFDGVLAARADSDDLDEQDFEAVRGLLKLRLYPANFGAETDIKLVSFPLSPDIVVALVYDLPMAVTTVLPERTDEWGVPVRDLFATALANVLHDEPVDIEELHFADGAQITALSSDTFFAATHALLLEEHFDIPELGAIIAIPNRHLVLFHAIEDMRVTTAVNALAVSAQRRYEEGPGSISPYVYWWRRVSDTERELILFPTHIDGEQISVAIPDVFSREVLDLLVH